MLAEAFATCNKARVRPPVWWRLKQTKYLTLRFVLVGEWKDRGRRDEAADVNANPAGTEAAGAAATLENMTLFSARPRRSRALAAPTAKRCLSSCHRHRRGSDTNTETRNENSPRTCKPRQTRWFQLRPRRCGREQDGPSGTFSTAMRDRPTASPHPHPQPPPKLDLKTGLPTNGLFHPHLDADARGYLDAEPRADAHADACPHASAHQSRRCCCRCCCTASAPIPCCVAAMTAPTRNPFHHHRSMVQGWRPACARSGPRRCL